MLLDQPMAKAKSFSDLIAWREAHAFVLLVYRTTKKFPKDEMFGLTSQMRRAAVSITSNIAEGFVRQSKADKLHFYSMALSSLSEVLSQNFIAKDVEYFLKDDFTAVVDQGDRVGKFLNGLMRGIKTPATSY